MFIRTFILLMIGIIIGLIINRLWQDYRARQQRKQQPVKKVDKMVKCAYCGVHVLEHEALEESGKFYCCDKHRLADLANQD